MDIYTYAIDDFGYDVSYDIEYYKEYRDTLISQDPNLHSELSIIKLYDDFDIKYYLYRYRTYSIAPEHRIAAEITSTDRYATWIDCFNAFYKRYSTWITS